MADITPSVDDVALLLRTRTVGGPRQGGLGSDTGPEDLTTFDENTRPRAGEVDRICALAERDVSMALGNVVVPEELAEEARQVCALRAAQVTSLSFWGDSGGTATETLAASYLAALAALKELLHGAAVRLR